MSLNGTGIYFFVIVYLKYYIFDISTNYTVFINITEPKYTVTAINATKADFDIVNSAPQAGFNILSGDVVKAYIVDDLTNAVDRNSIILQ